jgi:transposase-like protein
LSLREVQEMMLERGIIISHETVRQWCAKFGQTYANGLRRRRARPGDTWHLDEVFIKIGGKTHYLWRAVDQDGSVLDILVTSRRDAKAATRFFRKLLKGLTYVPRVLVTDKLTSYGVAHRRLIPGVEHRRSKCLNNRAENSHQPTRARERAMRRFRSPGGGCAAVPVRVLRDLPALPTPPPPAYRQGIPPRDAHSIHRLERDHRHDHGSRLNGHTRDRPGANPGFTYPSAARSPTS